MFPGKSPEALQKALTNASYNGLIKLLRRPEALGYGKGMSPGEWGPVPQWERDIIAKAKAEMNAPYTPHTVWVKVPAWPEGEQP